MKIKIGARKSPLSIAQVKEVFQEIKAWAPDILFNLKTYTTTGDADLTTSLKEMEKTDFFTKEIDDGLLGAEIDIAIHSAKDLPATLPDELEIYAITKGVDPRDSVVLYPPFTLKTLPFSSIIGTSSKRREEYLKTIREDFRFFDIRGNIQQRLDLLKSRKIDALVVAESALIRLNLTHLHRVILDAQTTPLQGKLAVIGRKNNVLLKQLFQLINAV
ncbi:MAG: hydroxymethylbilane synthase [Chlamydiales bacterium]|nr:hydroxymethylbilane synthase [Chlamydiales bacterium]